MYNRIIAVASGNWVEWLSVDYWFSFVIYLFALAYPDTAGVLNFWYLSMIDEKRQMQKNYCASYKKILLGDKNL